MTTALSHQLLPADVAEFATRRELLGHLHTAARLAESAFAPVRALDFVLEGDPESDEEWIAIDVPVAEDVDDVLLRNAAFTRQWVASVPADVRSVIRVLYQFPPR